MRAATQPREVQVQIPEARPDGTCYQCGSRALFFEADDDYNVCLLCGRAQRFPGAAAIEPD